MLIPVPAPHWHEHNPWKDRLLYVPIEELAACWFLPDGKRDSWTMIDLLARWSQYGEKLDAYILLTGHTVLTAGVRYGPNPDHYLSPGFSLPKLIELRNEYLNTGIARTSSS